MIQVRYKHPFSYKQQRTYGHSNQVRKERKSPVAASSFSALKAVGWWPCCKPIYFEVFYFLSAVFPTFQNWALGQQPLFIGNLIVDQFATRPTSDGLQGWKGGNGSGWLPFSLSCLTKSPKLVTLHLRVPSIMSHSLVVFVWRFRKKMMLESAPSSFLILQFTIFTEITIPNVR